MRQVTYARRHSMAESRKVPLNTITLPPITIPPSDLDQTNLLRQIMQVNKTKSGSCNNEVLSPKLQEVQKSEDQDSKTPEQVRLEQNIRFLQDQHQLMLAGLHGEIESLKARNRELQFQLIFGKSSPNSSSSGSPSTPDEDLKHKLYASPKVLNNTTPLQVELLEKELGELKLQMQEQESRNLYLSAIVDEQKKQLERYDRRREKEQQQRSNAPGEAEVEVLRKLEDAESLIRQLRRENSDLRRENQGLNEARQSYRDAGFQPGRPQGHRGGSGRGHRNSNGHYNNRGGWFPPLHTQNFWQGGRPQHDRSHHGAPHDSTNLPDLAAAMNEGGSGSQSYHHGGHQGGGRKGSNNNHHYNAEGGRKHRGGHHKANKP